MQTYINKRAGFIMGRYQPEGAEIEMTDVQARLYLLEGRIARKPVAKRTAPKKKAEAATDADSGAGES